ncbi:helix-turn-helix transcriptional regulator [Streptomyces sp. SID13031]|uniref:helix-turn-helix domain-containing protein n=1 Tax=Streptomyces sp. SID13031 TaxID=2706046 RepID=UPI0013C5AC89|nr:helix-turn-helix transcriptional regulator [Streptomyces sp. SID13031]NEA32656.1 helix-turn-helix domain-containing protein [Streptomyces sp. SID13031]
MAGRSEAGPTALRIMLGAHLRRLRERAGVTRPEAGWAIRSSESKISRMELGRVGFKVRDIEDLLTLYSVTDAEERDRLVQLARDANNRGWWHRYHDVTPDWFDAYLGLEAAADLIRTYEVQFVPGLLQTPEYTRAVAALTSGTERPAVELDRVVALRKTRQAVLDRDPPLRLWAVIEESALRRPIGGPVVLRDQLAALFEAIHRPNVTVQIIPLGAAGHPATAGAFSVLRFPQADLPDVVYLEHLTSALYLDKPDDLDAYTQVLDSLTVSALPPQQAEEQLTAILRQLD